jgi:group I intron endonuclease
MVKKDNCLNNSANILTSSVAKYTLKDIFNIANPELKFINVEKEYQNIILKLNSVNSGGIYLFWLLDEPSKCYLGSAINLRKRFMVHYNNSLKNNNHPKFYNCVKKYKWSKFGFLVVELEKNQTFLREKENIWLNKLFNDFALRDNILNLLKSGNNWLNFKHSEQTKKLISELMKGKTLSELHQINISKGLLNQTKSEETKFKISLA